MIRPIANHALIAALLLSALGTVASCQQEECTDPLVCGTPRPTSTPAPCVDPAFMIDYPHTWALLRQATIEAQIYETVLTNEGWAQQIMWSYYLVNWEDLPNGTIAQTETPCAMESSQIEIETKLGTTRKQQTIIPQNLIDHVAPAVWNATLEVDEQADVETGECQVTYTLNDSAYGPQYWVLGAHLTDPARETCPESADDPRQYDQDEDGHPGVTTIQKVNEDESEVYVCSRTLYRFEPGTVEEIAGKGYRIQGKMVDLVIDQSSFGSNNSALEGTDPESRWTPNDVTYYVLVNLPDGATCADVTRDLFFDDL